MNVNNTISQPDYPDDYAFDPVQQAHIAERLQRVRERIAAACARVSRHPDDVTLIAVSKTHPVDLVLAAYRAGQRHFGENRIEEAAPKRDAADKVAPNAIWHMIGHVQSRKAEDVVLGMDLVHSVDSVKLAERYSRMGERHGKQVQILLEMNVSGETSKDGFRAADWDMRDEIHDALLTDMSAIVKLPFVQVVGLMTVAPIVQQPDQARPYFVALRELREMFESRYRTLHLPHLSMGMTDDYEVAIEEGATLIRVGRAIFGERDYPAG